MNEQKNIAHSATNTVSENKEITKSIIAKEYPESKYYWLGYSAPYEDVVVDELDATEFMLNRCGIDIVNVTAPDHDEFMQSFLEWFFDQGPFEKVYYDSIEDESKRDEEIWWPFPTTEHLEETA